MMLRKLDQLGLRVKFQFAHEPDAISLDGSGMDGERGGDFSTGFSSRRMPQHLSLAAAQSS